MTFAVIMVRGSINVKGDIKRTIELMNLNRVNHCVLIPEDKVSIGMLNKAKDYITWGEIDEETLVEMINARGKITGDKALDDATHQRDGTRFRRRACKRCSRRRYPFCFLLMVSNLCLD